MAQVIAAGCITPKVVARRLGGILPTRCVRRSMRTLSRHYAELRKQVREHNRRMPEMKAEKVKPSAIWHFIMTGRTSSRKLRKAWDTHPSVGRVMRTCVSFRRMIHGEEGAPDVTAWIEQARECRVREVTEFAEFIGKDKAAVEQACMTNYSNAVMEGTVNKIKAVKRSMYNRAHVQILRAKLIYGGEKQNWVYHLN